MLRLARLKRIIGQRMGSRYGLVSEVSGFIVLFFVIIYVGHLLACFWYYIGLANDAPSNLAGGAPVPAQGWVQAEYCCEADESPPCAGMNCLDRDFTKISVSERYVTSLYYVFNALERAYTFGERGYAVFAEL